MRRTGKYYWLTGLAYCSLVVGLVIIFLFSGVIVESTPAMIVGTCICAFSNGIGVTTTLIGLSKYLVPKRSYALR